MNLKFRVKNKKTNEEILVSINSFGTITDLNTKTIINPEDCQIEIYSGFNDKANFQLYENDVVVKDVIQNNKKITLQYKIIQHDSGLWLLQCITPTYESIVEYLKNYHSQVELIHQVV